MFIDHWKNYERLKEERAPHGQLSKMLAELTERKPIQSPERQLTNNALNLQLFPHSKIGHDVSLNAKIRLWTPDHFKVQIKIIQVDYTARLP